MVVRIGDAVSLNAPDESIIPDDRQTQIQTIGGVAIQDYGHIQTGDTVQWSGLQMMQYDAEIVESYWNSRETVTCTNAGLQTFSARVVVKSWKRIPRFEKKAVEMNVELWLVNGWEVS